MFALKNVIRRNNKEADSFDAMLAKLSAMTKPDTQERRLLLVEDQPSDVALAREMLYDCMPDYQWQVVDRPSMANAIALVHDVRFDMVMLDLNLHDMEGPETVSALHTVVPSLPIIVYSGSSDLDMLQKALSNGAHFCIEKGITMPKVVRAMIQCALMPEPTY
jgi:DNA-binding NtrC family response regulator